MTLPDPETPFAELLRELADIAMSVTHHDASQDEPGYMHEVVEMERRFTPRIKAYIANKTRRERHHG